MFRSSKARAAARAADFLPNTRPTPRGKDRHCGSHDPHGKILKS
jgi:hypothetical protein